jgi:dTDP-4-amino-4,6-dideoxygalactose transaminase
VKFYPISDGFLPDWEILKCLIVDAKAKAVMSVNYFGFPQPIDWWQRLVKETGTVWINDNAQGDSSMRPGKTT